MKLKKCNNKKNKIKTTHCVNCGKLIKIKSKFDSSTKYCDSCAREMELEKYKRYNEKR